MALIGTKNTEVNRYELEITVDAATFEQAIERAYRKNVKSMSVQGFRKGKAPRKIIEKMYGEGVFFEDAINDLYPAAVDAAVAESKLDLVARPDVEISDVSKQDGVKIIAKCVTKPEVIVKDYFGIAVEKEIQPVSDGDVDQRLEQLRQKHARVLGITDRAAQLGDNVTFDFLGYVDGVPFEGGTAENFSLVLGSGQFIPGFEAQMEGKKIGEEFSVEVTFPQEYHAEALCGKPATFVCKIHAIEGKELPALDDEFAKDASEFDTLAELRTDVLKKEEEFRAKQGDEQVEGKLLDVIVEKMEGDIPQEMYEQRIDHLVEDFDCRLHSQGIDLDTYLHYTNMELESFRKTFQARAERQVKSRLALEKIAELENIVIDPAALDEAYATMADEYKTDVAQIKAFFRPEDLEMDLKLGQAAKCIREHAVVTEVATKAAPSEQPTATEPTQPEVAEPKEAKPKAKPAAKAAAKPKKATKETAATSAEDSSDKA